VQIAERLALALSIPEAEQLAFVRLARAAPPVSPLPTPPPASDEIGRADLSGRAVRGFELGERIGSGGFGVVYRAVQKNVARDVAVKLILPQYADQPDFIRRFEAEAQVVARLEHPNIVPLYDYWREPGAAFLVMRLLRGGSLESLLADGPLEPDTLLPMLAQIGAALNSAHKAGVVHRDIKPANVLLDADGNAYLADFGIAKDVSFGHDSLDGAVVGSPAYFSPEQIQSEPVKSQTDIYCLGIMLFELLTGHKPFPGPTPMAYIQQHLGEPPPSLLTYRPHLPPALDTVLARAAAKRVADRYPDVGALLSDFQGALKGDPTLVPPFAPEAAELANPYKGLRPFNEADADDFFGRDTLVQALLARMSDTHDLARFLAVVGPSGSGKSSVVKASLLSALRRGGLPNSEQWFISEMTPGAHPWEELETALLRIAINPPPTLLSQLQADNRGLLRAVQRILPSDPEVELVLVIDQFEELFAIVEDEAIRADFLGSLVTALLDERSRLRVVITLRADFVDRPLQYVDFGELLQRCTEFVLPLSPDELEEAIVQPAAQRGLTLEPGLAADIVRDVGEEPGALPLLQYALTELFERRQGRQLTRAAYQASGGVLGALARRADELYGSLDHPARALARQLFLRLITPGEGAEDTRRRVPRSELESIQTPGILASPSAGTGIKPGVMDQIIDLFGRYRLITFDRDSASRAPTVEVAHEALLREWGRLRAWLANSRTDLRFQRQLAAAAADWGAAGGDASFLLHGTRLAQFEEWAGQKKWP
jgi:serine/threonine protein kinase